MFYHNSMIDDTQKSVPVPPTQATLDPNSDMSDITDTDERAGMTQNHAQNQRTTTIQDDDTLQVTHGNISSAMEKRVNDVASETDSVASGSATLHSSLTTSEDQFENDSLSPSVHGEQSASGDMPDPTSDDDTLANAQMMGFQLDEDSENPKPLNMAADIDRAEEEAHK
jgi:hypothetical protein